MITITTKNGKRYYVVGFLPDGDAVDIVFTDNEDNIERAIYEMRVDPDGGIPSGCDDILVTSLDEVDNAIMANEMVKRSFRSGSCCR